MIENYNVFKGIKQVFESTYTALTDSQKEGYLWFVRKDTATTVGDIHFGAKQYSEVDTPIPNADIDSIWDDVMNGGQLTDITFTISGKSYQAESGMTFEEWVESEYNVVENPYTGKGSVNNGNFYVNRDKTSTIRITTGASEVYGVYLAGGTVVDSSTIITPNYAYRLQTVKV